MLELQVTGQNIKVISTTPLGDPLVSGTIKEYQCRFEFDETWEGYAKTVYFLIDNRNGYSCECSGEDNNQPVLVPMGIDNICEIPVEVLQPGNRIRIGVNGVKGDYVRPTVYTGPLLVRIGASTDVPCPDTDTYDRIIQLVEETKEIAQSVRDDADAGLFDGSEVIQADIAPISKTEAEWNDIGAYGRTAEFSGIRNAGEYRIDDIAMIAGIVNDRNNAVSMLFIRVTDIVVPDGIKGVSVGLVWGKPGKGIPVGGKAGQILFKKSDGTYDTQWGNVPTHVWDEILEKPFKVLNVDEFEVLEDVLNIKAVEIKKVTGLTEALDSKLNGVKVNGEVQPPVDHVVDITVPTKTSQLENNSGYLTAATIPNEYVTDNELQLELNKKLNLSGGTMTGKIDMASFGIANLPKAIANGEPVTFEQLNEAIAGIGTVFNLKGSKPTYADLPKVDNKIGDVWYVEDESVGYIWIEKNGVLSWEPFGPEIDLSGYLQKALLAQTTGSQTDNAMSQDATTKELNKKLSIEEQTLSEAQKSQVRKNIGASTYTILREW